MPSSSLDNHNCRIMPGPCPCTEVFAIQTDGGCLTSRAFLQGGWAVQAALSLLTFAQTTADARPVRREAGKPPARAPALPATSFLCSVAQLSTLDGPISTAARLCFGGAVAAPLAAALPWLAARPAPDAEAAGSHPLLLAAKALECIAASAPEAVQQLRSGGSADWKALKLAAASAAVLQPDALAPAAYSALSSASEQIHRAGENEAVAASSQAAGPSLSAAAAAEAADGRPAAVASLDASPALQDPLQVQHTPCQCTR